MIAHSAEEASWQNCADASSKAWCLTGNLLCHNRDGHNFMCFAFELQIVSPKTYQGVINDVNYWATWSPRRKKRRCVCRDSNVLTVRICGFPGDLNFGHPATLAYRKWMRWMTERIRHETLNFLVRMSQLSNKKLGYCLSSRASEDSGKMKRGSV